MESQVFYRSVVRVERIKGPLKRAYLPLNTGPIEMGVHNELADHYKIDTNIHKPTVSTLDYLVASVAACLTGTFGGALEGRGIPAGEGYLSTLAIGELEKEDNVPVIKRININYHLKTKPENRETVDRVLGFHANHCASARSVRDSIDIITRVEYEDI